MVPQPQPGVPVTEQPKKKSKKKIFIIIGAIVLVILIVVGVIIGINVYRSNTYDNAVEALYAGEYEQARDAFEGLGDYKEAAALMTLAQQGLDYEAATAFLDAGDYEAALSVFRRLGSYGNSVTMATFCENTIDYEAATALLDAGDYEAALSVFIALGSFEDSASLATLCENKVAYAAAEQKYNEKDYYGAYQAFEALGSYEDAAERMQQCTTPYPSTGEIYHNGSYVSSSSAIVIDGGNASYAGYYKVYSGSDLVSTIFLNPGGKCSIDVPSGNYTIKEASGDVWFGEEIMFGDDGYYEVMLFDEGNDYFLLEYNIRVTITLSVANGDVGSLPTGRQGF
jgi:tetratricopeptide (TPR) repeat protein